MAFIKSLILILLVFILILSLIIFMVNYAFTNTFLSGEFITDTLHDSDIIKTARGYGESEIENMDLRDVLGEEGEAVGELPDEVIQMKEIIVENLDFDFIEEQIWSFTKGSIMYITAANEKLPVIEFRPFVDMFFEAFISIAIMQGNAEDNEENRQLAREVLTENLNLEGVKEKVSLSSAINTLFGTWNNPVLDLREILKGYKNIIGFNFPLILLSLFLLIVIVGFRPKWFLGWLAPVGIISGLIFLAAGFFARAPGMFIKSNYTELTMNTSLPEIFNEPIVYIGTAFINRFSGIFLFGGALLFILGVVFIITASIIPGKHRRMMNGYIQQNPQMMVSQPVPMQAAAEPANPDMNSQPITEQQPIQPAEIQQNIRQGDFQPVESKGSGTGAVEVLLRVIAFCAVCYFAFYIGNLGYKDMEKRVRKFTETLEYIQEHPAKDTNEILADITGLDFDMLMGD